MPSWNWPALINRISQDIPFIQQALTALLKQDPTGIEDVPVGAKRLTEVSSGNWQVQKYNGETWENIGKLKMDVDTVDGYHASITPNANTVAVRGSDKKLQGDITGNAATASSAVTLSETLPVNKGGTGATTSAAARTALGVPPTSHASSSTGYGIGTDTNYGHVRSDGTTTKMAAGEVMAINIAIGGNAGDLASTRGQIGECATASNSVKDFNEYVKSGAHWFTNSIAAACANKPSSIGGILLVYAATGNKYIQQIYYEYTGAHAYMRACNNGIWTDWIYVIVSTTIATTSVYGIVKLTSAVNSTAENLAATPKAVKTAYDKAVAAANAAAAIGLATTTVAGLVKPGTGLTVNAAGALSVIFNNTVTSTSTTQAATPNAVKMAYDKAVAAYNSATTGFPAPDFSKKVKQAMGTLYTASADGYVYANAISDAWRKGFYLNINGTDIFMSQTANYGATSAPIIVPIKKGAKYKTDLKNTAGQAGFDGYGTSEIYFIPIAR